MPFPLPSAPVPAVTVSPNVSPPDCVVGRIDDVVAVVVARGSGVARDNAVAKRQILRVAWIVESAQTNGRLVDDLTIAQQVGLRNERKRGSAAPKCGINARRNRRMSW